MTTNDRSPDVRLQLAASDGGDNITEPLGAAGLARSDRGGGVSYGSHRGERPGCTRIHDAAGLRHSPSIYAQPSRTPPSRSAAGPRGSVRRTAGASSVSRRRAKDVQIWELCLRTRGCGSMYPPATRADGLEVVVRRSSERTDQDHLRGMCERNRPNCTYGTSISTATKLVKLPIAAKASRRQAKLGVSVSPPPKGQARPAQHCVSPTSYPGGCLVQRQHTSARPAAPHHHGAQSAPALDSRVP